MFSHGKNLPMLVAILAFASIPVIGSGLFLLLLSAVMNGGFKPTRKLSRRQQRELAEWVAQREQRKAKRAASTA
jgi:hypothetical protein